MQHFDNKTSPLKDDLNDRTLRSSSPAIKRPAADMGGKEREDVDMADDTIIAGGSSSANAASQSNNGKRQKSAIPEIHVSDPGAVAQTAPSEESSISDTTLADTSRSSTAATSIMDTTDTTDTGSVPSIDEQIATVRKMILDNPKDGDKGYCISGKWLRRVLARGSEPEPGYEKSDLEGEIGPVDNSDIAMVAEDSGTLKDQAGEIYTFLRPGVTISDEMQVFPQEAWDMVVRLYGIAPGSPVITRYAHNVSVDGTNSEEVQWELFPPVHPLLKVIGTSTVQTQKDSDLPPPRMVSSVHRPYMEWLKEAKEKLHIDMSTKVRVWKVISGLKSASASGILTPIASRSASPAPGAEIIASAGSKMIIDVNTFALLSIGEQRELVDFKDHTMDVNYNGKSDLRTVGLARADVIVLEEQSSKNDEYPSENPTFTLKGAAKAKNLTVNAGRASPSPSMMTRGRAQREGKPKGIVGLQNLGNTCYMNSALQCIRSVDELTEYFRCGYYKKELNFNNPLGHHGEVAKAYGNFIEGVYAASHNTFTPNALKKVIGKYGMQFQGYGQQDSQEFLAFLLDGLQEDLNRIQKKPYIEKPDSTDDMVGNDKLLKEFADRNWNDYKARNDSVITDLFAGMYKSTLTCPVCDKVSIVFDPFSNLTLQLPIENNWAKEIIYFPLNEKPLRIDIDIDKHSSILDLKKFIAERVGHDPMKMICAESYKNKFFKLFDNTEIIAETSISANDVVCVYELSETPTNYNPDKKKKFSVFSSSTKDADPKVDVDSPAADQLLTPIYHRVARPNGNNRMIRSYFGHPSYIVLSRADRTSYDGVFKKVLTQIVGMTTVDLVGDHTESSNPSEDSDTMLVDNESGSQSPSASGKSVQDEEEIVNVSMPDVSQAPVDAPSRESIIQSLMAPGRPVPEKYLNLFDIHVVHTDDGVPTGWNSLNDSTDYESLKEKAKELQRSLAHRPKRDIDDEGYDTSTDDPTDDQTDEQQTSVNSGSEDSAASPREESDDESISLPEATPVKDMRSASKHQKKKTYSRKGRRIVGKAPQKPRVSVQPQPKPVATDINELVIPGDALILDWDPDAYEALFEGSSADTMRGELTHRDPELFADDELAAKRASRLARKKNGVTLEDCLNEFGKTETLSEQNAWYCPRCKEHRRADKQFELWKVPDVLVMHLKRFSSARNFRDKLELKVEYPVEGLDLSTMVRDQSDGKSMIYDLIAVDNHYGGLGGGHYTAYAKNSVTGNWYDYNDSHVGPVKDPESVVTKSAYLLFYRRRTEHPLGGPQMEKILTEVDCEDLTTSRDGSPSGEGQRLGGSSHNGSSSASAGQAHRVGDGGSAANRQKQQKSKDLYQEQEDEGLAIYAGHLNNLSNSDAPPDYHDSSQDTMLLDQDETSFIGPTVPWSSHQQGWSFNKAPPSSNVDEDEFAGDQGFARFPSARRNSNASAANASSTAGLGGSDMGNVSDVADLGEFEDEIIAFDDDSSHRGGRESAPAPESRLPQTQIIKIPVATDEEELEVQELRLDSEKPTSPSS